MKPALERDKQIELMRDADKRIEARVSAWLKNPQIRASVSRTSKTDERYEVTSVKNKLQRCG